MKQTIEREQLRPAQTWAILGGAATMLTLAMGMRQSLGLFQPEVVRDVGMSAADFSLAIALQNMVWGLAQPFAGMLVDRYGARPVAVAGALSYLAGLVLALVMPSSLGFQLGLGVLIGVSLACNASQVAMSVTSRTVSPARRSAAMGMVSAVGSLGLILASPLAQTLITRFDWRVAMVAFCGLAAVIVPSAFLAGGADRIRIGNAHGEPQSMSQAVREATSHRGYLVMAAAYFVCGLQLVFLTTHLPTYLQICGLDASVAASALALIGLFNALGSWVFGWLGGRHSKRFLLGFIYVARSLIVTAYFTTVPTPTTTLLFAAAMGSLWLGVVPLVNGLVIDLFGLRYVTTLAGIAFMSHQVGSFLGAWGGGLIYSTLGSYEWAWKSAVIVGLVAGVAQMAMNIRPSARVLRERAATTMPATAS